MIDSGVVNATQDTASSWLREGRRFVQALLVDVEGSAPLPVGAMMIVDEHGNIEGPEGLVGNRRVGVARRLTPLSSPRHGRLLCERFLQITRFRHW